MKTSLDKLFVFLFVLIIGTLSFKKATATHAAGADIQFCWISGNTYQFTYVFYRNCGSPANPNPTQAPMQVTMRLVSASCGYNLQITLPQAGPPNGNEVSLACGNVLTYCNGGTVLGYQKWIYTTQYTLPNQCADWTFSVDLQNRNQNITTLNNPGNQSLTVVATLNNILAPDDCSPAFSNPPLAFLCVNNLMTYNHAAIDINGDSLVYTLVTPQQSISSTIQNVNYNFPFTATNPLSNTVLSLNSQTGQLNINPSVNGEVAVMAFRVDEYRNGQLIGSVVRDMQVYVQVCTNALPAASGLNNTTNYSWVVCPNVQSCFTIYSSDADPNDTLTMTWNNGIPAASFVVTGTPVPTGTFCWTPTTSDVGINVFTVQVHDNACPITGSQTYTYNIIVAPLPVIQTTGDQSICAGNSATIGASGANTYQWSPSTYLNTSTGPSVTSTPPQTQVYTVTGTSTDGCTGSTTVSVIVNPNPILFYPSNPTICSGGSIVINVSGADYYTWSPLTGIISNNPEYSQITVSLSSTQIYTVVGHTNEGCTGTATLTVTVNPNPVPVISSNSPICAGATLTLSTSGGTGYAWTGPNNFTSSSSSPSIPGATVAASGIYSVVVTDANTCQGTATANVTVNANPVPVVSTNSPVCAGITLTLSASGGTTYSWTGPNSFTSNSSSPTIPSSTVAATGLYTVVVGDANNCSTTATVNATVNANPVPVVSSNSPICAGSTLTLSASGGTTYSWTGPNSFSSGSATPSIPTATSAATGVYTVDVGDANNCHTTATVNVIVNDNPVPVVSSNSPVCSGSTLTLTASGGTTYSWTGPNGFSSNLSSPSISSSTVAATGIYTVVVGDANNCSTSATFSATVNANPVPVLGSNSPICDGFALNLTATGGTIYSWTGPNSFSSNQQNPSIVSASPAATGTYTVDVGDANGCHTISTISATVNPNPTPAIVPQGPTTFCDGGSVVLSGGSYSQYQWNTTPAQSTPTITVSETSTFNLQVWDVNGCTGTSSPVTITVNPNPTPVISPMGPTTFCDGGSVLLDGGAYSTYQWNTIPTQSTSTITVSETSTFDLQVWDANGCTGTSAPITITVNPNPAPVITPDGPLSFCEGGSVNLDAGTWASYEWSGQGEITQTIHVDETRTVDVTVTDNNGCTGTSAPLTVTENPLPPAVVTPAGPVLICTNNPATLSANTAAGYTYQWYNNTIEINGATSSDYLAATTGLYSVRIWDANNCTSLSNSVQVTQGFGPPVTIVASPGIGCLLNTIFIGYGPQSITLTAEATGAVAWLWSTGATTRTISVTQPGNYTVIAYDVNGCPSPSPGVLSPPIQVVDIRCGHNLKKVILCHVPEGNFDNPQTICIGEPAIEPHLRLHRWDCLGPCSLYYNRGSIQEVGDFYVIPSPNPFDNSFTLHILTTEYVNSVVVNIMDVTGRLVEHHTDVNEQTVIGTNLKTGVYIAEVWQGDNRQVLQIVKSK